jgi:hypothetical protein
MDDHHFGYITKLIEKTFVAIQKSYKYDIYYYNHAFNAIICHIHQIFLYVYPT